MPDPAKFAALSAGQAAAVAHVAAMTWALRRAPSGRPAHPSQPVTRPTTRRTGPLGAATRWRPGHLQDGRGDVRPWEQALCRPNVRDVTLRLDPAVVEWLSSQDNPPVRYLTARDLRRPPASADTLAALREQVPAWAPLARILALQHRDGSSAAPGNPNDARRTFWALLLMQRCGLDARDEPAARAIEHLDRRHRTADAVSCNTGGSGVLPCYLGVVTTALIKMGALDTGIVQSSIRWLTGHQRFDHKTTRAGGDEHWPYRAPENYGCWQSVSCYHGVAGAFRALAAIPPERRTTEMRQRLDEAIEYLRIHRLYKSSRTSRPLFAHMTQTFLIGDYRSGLLDMLQGIADADPALIRQDWVQDAVGDMHQRAPDGRVILVKNYGRALIDPIPFEPLGEPSRFLTYQWALIQRTFGAETPARKALKSRQLRQRQRLQQVSVSQPGNGGHVVRRPELAAMPGVLTEEINPAFVGRRQRTRAGVTPGLVRELCRG
jgi:hypothetical protein